MSEAKRTDRGIEKTVRGMKTVDGAGVRLTRLLGTPVLRRVDPFLMLDDFGSDDPKNYIAGFPEHPHRGFETITYMIQGRFKHRDNKGNEVVSDPGSAQWMTAGRGIVHEEIPMQKEGAVRGFQLWLNLPAKDKMREPDYRAFERDRIPVAKLEGGVLVHVLAGKVADVVGPIGDRDTEPVYLDVEIPEGAHVTLPIPSGHNGFAHVFEGGDAVVETSAGPRDLLRGELAVLTDGDRLRLRPKHGPTRVLVVAGKPLREPVVQYGPFVMNTMEQIEEAVRDFQAGRF